MKDKGILFTVVDYTIPCKTRVFVY